MVLDVKPSIGIDESKNGLLSHLKITFEEGYPFKAPTFEFIIKKGLEQEQFEEIIQKMNEELNTIT